MGNVELTLYIEIDVTDTYEAKNINCLAFKSVS